MPRTGSEESFTFDPGGLGSGNHWSLEGQTILATMESHSSSYLRVVIVKPRLAYVSSEPLEIPSKLGGAPALKELAAAVVFKSIPNRDTLFLPIETSGRDFTFGEAKAVMELSGLVASDAYGHPAYLPMEFEDEKMKAPNTNAPQPGLPET